MALLASNVPCIPNIPKNCGSSPGYAPNPCNVDVIGKPVKETNTLPEGNDVSNETISSNDSASKPNDQLDPDSVNK